MKREEVKISEEGIAKREEVKISEEGIVKKEEVKIPNALAFGIFGVPEGIRTSDLPLRRRSLYPTELLRQIFYKPYYIL